MSPPLRPRFKPQPGFRCASEVRREPLTMRELVWPVVFLWCGVCTSVAADWERPGCHKVGHTRRINIPECVEFSMTTNACRGFCESWSIPSSLETALVNPHQPITSIGQCCNIMDTEDVEVTVMCLDGPRDLVFKSATSCSCFHCKKD